MYTVWEAVRKYQKLTLTSVETLALRNRTVTMDEGNFLGHNVYLVKKKKSSCMLYYGTQLLRVEGWSQTAITLNKLSEKCEEDNRLFLSSSAVNESQGKKEPTDMKDILKELSCLGGKKIHK